MTSHAETKTTKGVPLLDLNGQYEGIEAQIMASIKAVFDAKQFIMGPQIPAFEAELSAYCGTSHALGVSSGTDALLLALMGLDIGPGDEVITSPFTFFATAGCITRVGARPVFVDIDPKTFNIDPRQIEAKITPKTKAIMPVHLFGQMADMDPIMDLAHKYHLFVIEDACQAIGSTYKGKMAGSIGHVGCFSFFPSKNLGCCGDGGAVITNDFALAEKMAVLRVHGAKPRYFHSMIGGNFRMDSIQAAVLSVKLPFLEAQHEQRIKNGEYYTQALKDTIETPHLSQQGRMIYNQYTVRTTRRNDLQSHLEHLNIGSAVYYPVPLHLQECFDYLGHQKGDFPESEKAADEVLSIPIYAELTQDQQDTVIQAIKAFK